jgi:iron complex transport system substrate-binding protein
MPTRLTPLAVLALALLCASCGFKSEPTGVLAAYPQTVRDALGHPVRIDAAPHRIVSLDPGMTAAMYALGAGDMLVGRSGRETYPKKALRLPVMLKDGKPDVRAIERAGPQVVLVPASITPTLADVNALERKVAAVVYVVDGRSVDGVENDITELGLITNRASPGRSLATGIQTRVKQIRAAVAHEAPARAFVDLGFSYTIEPGSMAADLLRLAGGQNVAAEVDPSRPVSGTTLATLAPEVYLSVGDTGATLKQLAHHPATASIPAVTDRRVVQLSGAVLQEDGPHVTDALARIAQLLHPDATIPG